MSSQENMASNIIPLSWSKTVCKLELESRHKNNTNLPKILWHYSKIMISALYKQEQEQKKQQAYEEFLKEKLMIDEIVRKIYEEDQR